MGWESVDGTMAGDGGDCDIPSPESGDIRGEGRLEICERNFGNFTPLGATGILQTEE